jgi:hypothetical protein
LLPFFCYCASGYFIFTITSFPIQSFGITVPQDIALDYLAIDAGAVTGAIYTYDMIHFIRKLKRKRNGTDK